MIFRSQAENLASLPLRYEGIFLKSTVYIYKRLVAGRPRVNPHPWCVEVSAAMIRLTLKRWLLHFFLLEWLLIWRETRRAGQLWRSFYQVVVEGEKHDLDC